MVWRNKFSSKTVDEMKCYHFTYPQNLVQKWKCSSNQSLARPQVHFWTKIVLLGREAGSLVTRGWLMGWYFVSLVHNESAARSAQGDCQKRLISGCQKLIDNCTVLCRDCLVLFSPWPAAAQTGCSLRSVSPRCGGEHKNIIFNIRPVMLLSTFYHNF